MPSIAAQRVLSVIWAPNQPLPHPHTHKLTIRQNEQAAPRLKSKPNPTPTAALAVVHAHAAIKWKSIFTLTTSHITKNKNEKKL